MLESAKMWSLKDKFREQTEKEGASEETASLEEKVIKRRRGRKLSAKKRTSK